VCARPQGTRRLCRRPCMGANFTPNRRDRPRGLTVMRPARTACGFRLAIDGSAQPITMPPSTLNAARVVKSQSSDATNSAIRATSSVVPSRPKVSVTRSCPTRCPACRRRRPGARQRRARAGRRSAVGDAPRHPAERAAGDDHRIARWRSLRVSRTVFAEMVAAKTGIGCLIFEGARSHQNGADHRRHDCDGAAVARDRPVPFASDRERRLSNPPQPTRSNRCRAGRKRRAGACQCVG